MSSQPRCVNYQVQHRTYARNYCSTRIGGEHCPSQMTLVIGTSKKTSKLVLADKISKSLADKVSKNIGIEALQH